MRNDPYETKARFESKCSKCEMWIKKGQKIIYWPIGRKLYCEDCGESDFRKFEAEKQDEDGGY